jgi:hypothetical protein
MPFPWVNYEELQSIESHIESKAPEPDAVNLDARYWQNCNTGKQMENK